MNGAFVRYFCPVTEGGDDRGDAAYDYFEAIKLSGFPVRVLTSGGVSQAMTVPRWAKHDGIFTREIPRHYLNVVSCLQKNEIGRLFTVGVPNVAIIYDYDDVQGSRILDFDLVVCSKFKDALRFIKDGVSAVWARPEHDLIAPLLRELI